MSWYINYIVVYILNVEIRYIHNRGLQTYYYILNIEVIIIGFFFCDTKLLRKFFCTLFRKKEFLVKHTF